MANARRKLVNELVEQYTSQATIPDGAAVVMGTADSSCALPAGADPDYGVLGLAVNSSVSGGIQDVATDGCIYPGIVEAGQVATRGKLARISTATGQVKDCVPVAGGGVGAGTKTMVVGEFLESGTAGQRVAIRIRIQAIYV